MATRPQFPAEAFAAEIDEASLAEFKQDWDEEMRERELRGPLRFSFTQPHACGFMIIEEETGNSRSQALTGEFDVDVFEGASVCEAYGLTVEDITKNPFEHVADFTLVGATDEHVRALCAKDGLRHLDVSGQVPEDTDLLDDAIDEDDEDITATLEELEAWHRVAQTQAGTLTDACIEKLPVDLESLRLRSTTLTDEAVARALAPQTNLESVGIQSDRLTGAFLAALANSRELVDFGVESDALRGSDIVANLPHLPQVESAQFVGEGVLDGFDATVVRERLPQLEDLVINPKTLTTPEHFKLALALPGVTINDVTLTEKAIRKGAAKLGIEL